MFRKLLRWGVMLAACALWGCAVYRPAPLEPAKVAREFESRSMANAGLCSYLRANLADGGKVCPAPRWNLEYLSLVGFYYNPEIEVASAQVAHANAAVITAGALPNPSVRAGPQYDVSTPNFAPWGLGYFSLDVPFETAGKRGYRIAQAEKLADAARISAGQTAWNVRSAIRAAMLKYMIDRRSYRLAVDQLATLKRVAAFIAQRLRAGDASQPQLNLALAAVQNATLVVAKAKARIPADKVAIAKAVGLPDEAIDGARLSWPELNDPPRLTSLSFAQVQRMALLNRLDLRAELFRYAAADEALKLQIANQYPNLNLVGGYSWGAGDNTFELGPTLTLPVFNQNQGPIAEAEAARKEVAAQFLAMQAGIIAQSRAALIEYRGALAALKAARAAANFEARTLAQAKRSFAAGESGNLTLATARLQDLVAQRNLLNSVAQAQSALGALENSMQHPLGSGDSTRFVLPPPRKSAQGANDWD